MSIFAGIDIGSTFIKIVLVDESGALIGHRTAPTGGLFRRNAAEAMALLLAETGRQREELLYSVATGYGRKLYVDADESISEITANAVGARTVGAGDGLVRTVINIGGQDLKVIRLDEDGHVENFAMNDKCAAGTGRFLEMTARNLEVDVEDLGRLHLLDQGVPLTINSTCTVFAESEIISLLAAGKKREQVAAAIHYSIARRVARLARRLGLEGAVLFDGGPALNGGLVRALEDELMCSLLVPELPQITCALGAALLAGEYYGALDAAANG